MSLGLERTLESLLFLSSEPVEASALADATGAELHEVVTALERLRAMQLPHHPEFGPSTLNIGIIEGGRATNVISDHARAQLLYRLVGPSEGLSAGLSVRL